MPSPAGSVKPQRQGHTLLSEDSGLLIALEISACVCVCVCVPAGDVGQHDAVHTLQSWTGSGCEAALWSRSPPFLCTPRQQLPGTHLFY